VLLRQLRDLLFLALVLTLSHLPEQDSRVIPYRSSNVICAERKQQ
jgi:hypothetical protein